MEVLFTAAQIAARVRALAAEIAAALPAAARDGGLVIVGPLKGCLVFQADLMRAMSAHLPWLECDHLGLSSYGGGTESSGRVTLLSGLRHPVAGRHVLLVDDIADTGRTLAFAQAHLRALEPASLRTAALLDKPSRRVVDVPLEHVGFVIEDLFVLGYGTDLAERYRALPEIVIYQP